MCFSRQSVAQLMAPNITHYRAVNSVGECHLHTVEVTGSNPVPPTTQFLLKYVHLDIIIRTEHDSVRLRPRLLKDIYQIGHF